LLLIFVVSASDFLERLASKMTCIVSSGSHQLHIAVVLWRFCAEEGSEERKCRRWNIIGGSHWTRGTQLSILVCVWSVHYELFVVFNCQLLCVQCLAVLKFSHYMVKIWTRVWCLLW